MTGRSVNLLRLIIGFLLIAALLALPPVLNRYGLYVMSLWAVMTIAALGLNLTLGYAGQVSIAQGAFVGIGAYSGALITMAGYPFILGLVTAALLCFAIGWALGYPALKVRHHYLAFVTLAFSTLAFLVFRNEEWLTGGVAGLSGIARPVILGLSTKPPLIYCYFTLGLLAVVAGALWWLVRSPWGRAFRALRENPLRAASLGVDTRRYTLLAFAIGSAVGGIAGAAYGPLVQYIDPLPFSLDLSLKILLMVVVGGAGYFLGPFCGAFVAVLLPELLRVAEGYYLMIYALLVMVLMVFAPSGIIGIGARIAAAGRARRASALRAATQASLPSESL